MYNFVSTNTSFVLLAKVRPTVLKYLTGVQKKASMGKLTTVYCYQTLLLT